MKAKDLKRLINDNVVDDNETDVWIEGCDCVAEAVGISLVGTDKPTVIINRRKPQFRAKSDAMDEAGMQAAIKQFLREVKQNGYSWEEAKDMMPSLHQRDTNVRQEP